MGPDAERIIRDNLHTLGNLTLITQDWNSSLSNKSFAIKKQKLLGHALKLNSDYFEQEIEEWDEEAIRTRIAWLPDKIIEVWPALSQDDAPQAVTTAAAASFHEDCVSRVSAFLGEKYLKQGNTAFATADSTHRLICSVSKQYIRSSQVLYWYAFHPSQQEFLSLAEKGLRRLRVWFSGESSAYPSRSFFALSGRNEHERQRR